MLVLVGRWWDIIHLNGSIPVHPQRQTDGERRRSSLGKSRGAGPGEGRRCRSSRPTLVCRRWRAGSSALRFGIYGPRNSSCAICEVKKCDDWHKPNYKKNTPATPNSLSDCLLNETTFIRSGMFTLKLIYSQFITCKKLLSLLQTSLPFRMRIKSSRLIVIIFLKNEVDEVVRDQHPSHPSNPRSRFPLSRSKNE